MHKLDEREEEIPYEKWVCVDTRLIILSFVITHVLFRFWRLRVVLSICIENLSYMVTCGGYAV